MKYLTLSAAILFFAACSETEKDKNVTGDADTAVLQREGNISADKMEYTNWDEVDFTSPIVRYDEIQDRDVQVRASNPQPQAQGQQSQEQQPPSYSIYEFDETVLFDLNKSDIRSQGTSKLDQIASSINQRFPNGQIRLYGFTDSIYTKEYNQTLSRQRAESVKDYLVQKGIDASRISVQGEGQSDPVATNETAKGRQQNRRVEIVVRHQ